MFSIGLGLDTQEQHRYTTSSNIDESLSMWLTAGLRFRFRTSTQAEKLVEEDELWSV
jgi:hypothetical protein